MKKKKQILIVDDDAGICELMMELLTMKGFDVVTATNGVEGLRLLAEKKIDLIVLDLNMPRMDGYMFMERMDARWRDEELTEVKPNILILSAVEKKQDLGLATNLGAREFMRKPFRNDDFVETVKRLLKV